MSIKRITLAVATVAILVGALTIVRLTLWPGNKPKGAAAETRHVVPSNGVNEAAIETALPAFRRVNHNYFRGAEPLRGGIGTLVELGVKTVVDLRSKYDRTEDVRIAAERMGLRYQWVPMSVWDPPTHEEANRFIELVADQSRGPFFVFCTDGLHRTGEMTAIYRVASEGWGVEQALKEMDDVGFSPYYYSLRNYVWDYARKFRPSAVPAGARRSWPAS